MPQARRTSRVPRNRPPFVTTGAADTTHNGGGNDGFIARLNAAGSTFLYSTFAGSSDSDGVTLLEIDAAGSAYALLGDAAGTAFVSSGGLAHAGNADDYFVKLNAAGNTFLDASYFGGIEDEFSLAMAVDTQQNLYLGGSTSSANLPVTAGVVQPAKASTGTGEDAFLVKFATTPDGPVVQPGQLALTAAAFTVAEGAGTASISVARSGSSVLARWVCDLHCGDAGFQYGDGRQRLHRRRGHAELGGWRRGQQDLQRDHRE